MNKEIQRKRIQCLVPDLPSPAELYPYLEKMHDNRWYSNFGELSIAFESGVIDLLAQTTLDDPGQIFCCSTSSGTAALEIALCALNLKPNSRVLVPSLTFPASATSILRSGLIPLISDVCCESWQLTPAMAFALAKEYDIAAVIPVATFGAPVDSIAWDRFTQQTKIPVIIDAAGAFPFQKIPKHCPVIFSFHATKAFGIGEGGGIFVKSQLLNRRHRHLSNFGFKNGLIFELGFNAKLSEYHSAVGLAQLQRWPRLKAKRSKIELKYSELLGDLEPMINQQVITHHTLLSLIPSLKVIQTSSPTTPIIKQLSRSNIELKKWYLPALHHQPIFKNRAIIACQNQSSVINDLPNTNYLSEHLLGLPFHNFLKLDDISRVINKIANVLATDEFANG